jgi:RNA polymerase sigma factor (sigma-70 family)
MGIIVAELDKSKEPVFRAAITAGNSAAWRELLNGLIPKLYKLFMTRWQNQSLAEEMVQKTVFDAVRGRQGYDPAKGGPEDWIFGIAYNNIRMELRKRASAPSVNGDASKYLQAMDTQLLPDQALEQKEMAQRVRATLDKLADRERDVLKARYLEQIPISQIAVKMNVTEKAVYSLLYRAGISFRQQILHTTNDVTREDFYGN